MTKKAEKQSDEVTLVLATARVLRAHLTEHGSLKTMNAGAVELDDALKPFNEPTA